MPQRTLYSGLDLYDWRGSGPSGRTKVSDVDKWQQNQNDIRHFPGAFPVQSVVIADGQITPTAAAMTVDTEGGAPADDLTAIAPGDLHAGMLLALCSLDDSRKITIKNSAGASGIQTLDGKDVVLDTRYAVMLRLVSTESLTLWREEPGPLRLGLTVSTSDTLGGVKVQTGDDDGLEMIGDKLRSRKANSTQRGSVLASETAQPDTVPQAGESGILDPSWLPKTIFNTVETITVSGKYTPKVNGWHRVTVIGGGGKGGQGVCSADHSTTGSGGGKGGDSTFDSITATGGSGGGGGGHVSAGGGGSAGKIKIEYLLLTKGVHVNVTVGAGATVASMTGDGQGDDGGKPGVNTDNGSSGGQGAKGAGTGQGVGYGDFTPGSGGNGGSNGTGYGGGGGGGAGSSNQRAGITAQGGNGGDNGQGGQQIVAVSSGTVKAEGGNGGDGAVIVEYYDPSK